MGKHTREYRVWDETEEDALKAGVKKHGLGAWEIIRNDPEFEVLLSRTGVQLKDKWRNLVKFRHISLDDKELFHIKGAPGNKGEKQPPCKSPGKAVYNQNRVATLQESLRANEGRSGTPTDSDAICDRAYQKSFFRSSSRTRKSALAPDFVLDVDEDETDDVQVCLPARSLRRQNLSPSEDRRFGIYDKRRYKGSAAQGSASDVSDSACLGKVVSDYLIKCPCGATCDDGAEMIECEACQAWAHTMCLQNLMAEYPSLYRFDFSCYHCPYCQSDTAQRPSKRRATFPRFSVASQSSEQDSRDSASVFTTDCKSGTGDSGKKALQSTSRIKAEGTSMPLRQGSSAAEGLPKVPQKIRSKRGTKKRPGHEWCSWLLPEIRARPSNPFRCHLQRPDPSPFSMLSVQQPSSLSKACDILNCRAYGITPLSKPIGLDHKSTAVQATIPKPLDLHSHSVLNRPIECEASPVSVKTCHTAEFKIPVSVLCGDVTMNNSMLVLPDDCEDDDGAISSSHENPSAEVVRVDKVPSTAVLGSQSENELLGATSLDLPQERFSLDFTSRPDSTPPPLQSLPPLDLPLPSLAPSPLPLLPTSHPHFSSPFHSHPPLFNLPPMPAAALAAAVGKPESEASFLAHIPWMQALFTQPAWPLGLASGLTSSAAAAAAAAAVSVSPALELYKHGLAGLSLPPPALKLEPLSLGSTLKLDVLHNLPEITLNSAPVPTGITTAGSAGKSIPDHAACDAMLLPVLAELRSQTPDPTNFLNAPTPIPEMSLPFSGSCPLFDLPAMSALPLCRTPPLPDGLLNMPSLSAPFPSSTFEGIKVRTDDLGAAAFDFLHEFVNPDADEELTKTASQPKLAALA